jgi:serine/threonine protein kinase
MWIKLLLSKLTIGSAFKVPVACGELHLHQYCCWYLQHRHKELFLPYQNNAGRHGTVGFVSPEVWNLRISGEGMGPVEDREFWPADIFSFGIIAYMLLAGTGTDSAPHPYDSAPSGSPLGPDALQYRILHDNKRDHYLDLLPENDAEARNLVEATLQRDPKKRPTAQEVVSHPFFYTPTERLHHLNRWSAKLYDR